jgi:hypothetical protein
MVLFCAVQRTENNCSVDLFDELQEWSSLAEEISRLRSSQRLRLEAANSQIASMKRARDAALVELQRESALVLFFLRSTSPSD